MLSTNLSYPDLLVSYTRSRLSSGERRVSLGEDLRRRNENGNAGMQGRDLQKNYSATPSRFWLIDCPERTTTRAQAIGKTTLPSNVVSDDKNLSRSAIPL